MPSPCKECGARPKIAGRHRCVVCQTRNEGITERAAESRRRLAMVPLELRLRVVPARLWPAGSRWCSGCQSFVDLEDVPTNGSRCRACSSVVSHEAMIVKTYGVDGDEYARLLELQGGKCAICRNKPKKTRLAVDHDHKTGANRGLLCSRCNHELLGAGWDSRAVLIAAVTYLDTPPATGHWVAPEENAQRPAKPSAPSGGSTPADDFLEAGAPAPRARPTLAKDWRDKDELGGEDTIARDFLAAERLAAVRAPYLAPASWVDRGSHWVLYKDPDGFPDSPPPF